MGVLLALCAALGWVNAAVLAAGRWIGVGFLMVMVATILMQVFYRYVLGNALAWSEELSRFLMLWATALMAPTAYRQGGFVAITMLTAMLPRLLGALLTLMFLGVAGAVLWVGLRIGWGEVTGFGGRFATDALWVPASLDLSAWVKVPRAWAMASLASACTILLAVNAELALRSLAALFGAADRLPAIAGEAQAAGAE